MENIYQKERQHVPELLSKLTRVEENQPWLMKLVHHLTSEYIFKLQLTSRKQLYIHPMVITDDTCWILDQSDPFL